MRLTVVVPSAQFLSTAGNRIRYQRMREPLAEAGCELAITTIDDFSTNYVKSRRNIVLFSKVQDGRGLALADTLRTGGARVGVDLYDDYFSQAEDARFAPQRLWLEDMARIADFFLCSTERMKQVAMGYFGSTPGHVLNDPFEHFEPNRLGPLLEAKRQAAVRDRRIDMLWFGMGNNPSFPIGLHDLAHYGTLLDRFRRLGFSLKLTVLTNARALDARGLSLLRQLPVQPSIEEWTAELETALLEQSLTSFLPVNGQGFSIAKSLNRAVTALTGGTQVLVAGHPLYRPLDAFVYTNPETMIGDLLGGTLRMAPGTLSALGDTLNLISNPISESRALHAFLETVFARSPLASTASAPLAILHGNQSASIVHKFARQQKWLSLGSPFAPVGMSYDAHLGVFDTGTPPRLRLTKALASKLPRHLAKRARTLAAGGEDADKRTGLTIELCADDIVPNVELLLARAVTDQRPGARMVMQRKVMEITRTVLIKALGPLHFINSEQNPQLCQARELASTDHQVQN